MIEGIGTLLGFQLAGEFVARLLRVPIPGPIIGLILLFAFLQLRALTDLGTPEAIDATGVAQVATPLLRNLAILFVPSGVGVLQYLDLFIRHGPAVLLVLVASTFATMAVTALVFTATQALANPQLSRKLVRRARFGLSRLRRGAVIPIRRTSAQEQL
jgi:holin-like protein